MRHRLFIPAATALLFALAACTQDELCLLYTSDAADE